jgi:transposase
MQKNNTFDVIHINAAGIDIGSKNIYVSLDGIQVEIFSTFTSDYMKCLGYLKSNGVLNVAMEATGVYWIALYQLLQENGINVCLVNPKEVKQVKGRKSDVRDCQWIQKLFSSGLVQESFIPKGKLYELRMMVRERDDIIGMGGTYVNKMQKALELMNIKLTEVICQIQGASGLRMIKAIIDGERNAESLLALCDERIIMKKREEVLLALQGNFNETYLFILASNLQLWEIHQEHILNIDKKIESVLDELTIDRPHIAANSKPKQIRHHKPNVKNLHQKMLDMYGVNMSSLSGLNDYSLLRLLGETGNDLSRFPSVKHFISWCQLSPRHSQSGLMKKRIRIKNRSYAGQIFRDAARSLLSSKNIAIGAFMRKLRSQKGAGIAIKAGARKIAEAYYNMLTKGTHYVEHGIEKYNLLMRERELKLLNTLATKHNVNLAFG